MGMPPEKPRNKRVDPNPLNAADLPNSGSTRRVRSLATHSQSLNFLLAQDVDVDRDDNPGESLGDNLVTYLLTCGHLTIKFNNQTDPRLG